MDVHDYEEEQIRCKERIAGRLGWERLPDAVWGHVVSSGLVSDAITRQDEWAWKELVDEAKSYIRGRRDDTESYIPSPERGDRSVNSEVVVELDDYTRERAETFTEIAAAFAERHPDVRNFRSEVLKGELLTDEQAEQFLFGSGERRAELESLNVIADRLARLYRWREGDAAWFVLTGRASLVRPIETRVSVRRGRDYHPNTARITLVADPSVDAEVIAKAYKDAQRQVNRGDNRKLYKSTLRKARFVAARIRSGGNESWEQLKLLWNKENPDAYIKSRTSLYEAFKALAHPDYDNANFPPYKPTPYQRARVKHNRRIASALKAANKRRRKL